MESSVDIEIFETLREPLSEGRAKNFVRLFDAKVEQFLNGKKDILATKDDVSRLERTVTEFRISTAQEIAALRGEMKQDVANAKADIIKWMFIFWAGQIATVIAIMKLL